MNTKEALKILKEQGYSFEVCGKKYYQLPGYYEYSARQLIKWAKCYTSEHKFNTAWKSPLKEFRHRKNRAKTKDDIHHERFDNFGKGLRKDEDPWNWD